MPQSKDPRHGRGYCPWEMCGKCRAPRTSVASPRPAHAGRILWAGLREDLAWRRLTLAPRTEPTLMCRRCVMDGRSKLAGVSARQDLRFFALELGLCQCTRLL